MFQTHKCLNERSQHLQLGNNLISAFRPCVGERELEKQLFLVDTKYPNPPQESVCRSVIGRDQERSANSNLLFEILYKQRFNSLHISISTHPVSRNSASHKEKASWKLNTGAVKHAAFTYENRRHPSRYPEVNVNLM